MKPLKPHKLITILIERLSRNLYFLGFCAAQFSLTDILIRKYD